MADFLFKTEPADYSFADLVAKGRGTWDGVRNPVALSPLTKQQAATIESLGQKREPGGRE